MAVSMKEKKAKVQEKRTESLVRAVRVDIIRPLGATWDDIGPILRRLRWAAARCLNVAMRACLIADVTGKQVARATEAYRAVNEQIAREKEYDPNVSVASQIASAWSKLASDAYTAHRSAILRGNESLPSYNKGAPIIVRADSWDLERDGKGYVLSTRLTEGRVGRYRFAVAANGSSAHGQLRGLLANDSDTRHGDLKIVYDERKRKWQGILTIISPKPPPLAVDPARLFAVHRGVRVMLTWATSDGEVGTLVEGGEVLAFKQQMHARRRSWYAHKRHMPSRARGRGYWRRYEQYRALEDKEARWVQTKLQQNAAAVVKLALARGCGTIVLDDWSAREAALSLDRDNKEHAAMIVRRWPFAAQRDAIAWAAQKNGLTVKIVVSEHESYRCPACGNIDATQDDGRGTFVCKACGLKRSVEQVAAWNQLARAGDAVAFDLNANRRKELCEQLRADAEAVTARNIEMKAKLHASSSEEVSTARGTAADKTREIATARKASGKLTRSRDKHETGSHN